MRKEIIEEEIVERFFANAIRTIPRHVLAGMQDGQQFGGSRDLYEVCGYARELTCEDYFAIYERGDIAARIVDAYPDATWRELPDITPEGELRDKFWSLFSGKRGLLSVMHRLDRLTQLGHYGVIHIGVDDGRPFHQPVGKASRVLYLQPHSEATAQISAWNTDATSPRYGKPELYRITTGTNWEGAGATQKIVSVHHSRVIHVAERALENESIGQPRLQRGWNRLQDLQKLAGGSVEAFWINAAMYIAFVAAPDVNWQPDEVADMKEDLEKMAHRLQRWLRLRGVDPKVLSAAIASPQPHFEMIIALLGGAYSIPKRILIGSERGELSSEQDEHNWSSAIIERRNQFAGPCILSPLIRWFQRYELLPPGDFDTKWPESDLLDATSRANIASKKTSALVAYSNAPGAESIVPVGAFREWLGEDPDETPDWREDDEYVPLPSDAPRPPQAPTAEPVSVEPEATALNGAQITSLREIAGAVAAGELPSATAIAILRVAFPSISDEAAEAIIAPLRDFAPSAEEVKA